MTTLVWAIMTGMFAVTTVSADIEQANKLSGEGWQLWQQGNMAAAADMFTKATQLNPNNADTWNGLGWSQLNLGDSIAAEKSFLKCVKLNSTHGAGLNGLGQVYLMWKEYPKAEKYLKKAAPQAPAAWYGLARLYLVQGDFEKAKPWTVRIAEENPKDATAQQMNKAAQSGKLDEALQIMLEPPGKPNDVQSTEPASQEAAGDVPADPERAKQLSREGWQLWQQHDMTAAVEKFSESVKLNPHDADTWNGLGWSQFSGGNSIAAEQSFLKCIKLNSTHSAGLNGLGQVYLMWKEYPKAEENLKKAAPQAPAAWYGLARLYLLQGDFEKAKPWAERLAAQDSADANAQQMLKAAQSGELDEALRIMLEPAGKPDVAEPAKPQTEARE